VRVSPHPDERTAGFSLVELLVVIIVIGVLAAIAVPLFVNQRAKAHDTAVKHDVSHIGKEFRAIMLDETDWSRAHLVRFKTDHTGPIMYLPDWRSPNSLFWGYRNAGGGIFASNLTYVGELSDGVVLNHTEALMTDPAYTGENPGTISPRNWCLSMRHPEGQTKDFRYTAQGGLAPGDCLTP
jgi:prepilin-type N-terminal cleavage/methylation domain-containing protein